MTERTDVRHRDSCAAEGRVDGEPSSGDGFEFDWGVKQEAVEKVCGSPSEQSNSAREGHSMTTVVLSVHSIVGSVWQWQGLDGRCRFEPMGISRNSGLSTLSRRPWRRQLRVEGVNR
jgi:hypothetical protein